MRILVTGGAGFIGSNLIRKLLVNGHKVLNIDKLTYAGNRATIHDLEETPAHQLVVGDICDQSLVERCFDEFKPQAVIHLAAESHVDRSILSPSSFISTNILGTYSMLQAALAYWRKCDAAIHHSFRFLHVSTDEVYGTLGTSGSFVEESRYDPRSPYSSSKAASDHLVRAWWHTYRLPVLIASSCNNYGPFQHPEKLIPTIILRSLCNAPIPIYGRGEQIRSWIHVSDNCYALQAILESGVLGETYNVSAESELSNLDMAHRICGLLDSIQRMRELNGPQQPVLQESFKSWKKLGTYSKLISFVDDRPGHDFRYSLDASKIQNALNWKPTVSLNSGLHETVMWYIRNQDWWESVKMRTQTP
ncbi:MAG: dTDP-glucose 4,6-dehydratase [Pirellula sp.]|jgi:dTDP-glucose 4,6-dehydratase|nr:dTDP-glucose 4,6-dehydratase [Pirellula sp.]